MVPAPALGARTIGEGADLHGSLGNPLLEARPLAAGASRAPLSGVRRLAGWRGPEPTVVLAAWLTLLGCAWLIDFRGKAAQATETVVTAPLGLDDDLYSNAWPTCRFSAVLVGVVVLAAFVLCQQLGERFLRRSLAKVCQELHDLGVGVEIGETSAWILCGRLDIRNLVLRTLEGSQSESILLVRRLSVDLGITGLLHVACGDVKIRELRMETVEVLVHSDNVSVKSKLQAVLDRFSELRLAAVPVTQHSCVIDKLVAKNVGPKSARGPCEDLRRFHFSREEGATTVGEVIPALMETIFHHAARPVDENLQTNQL
mmetsp:Transcript_46995/g.102265  ORF Transcript_46995/g.102265 Transcript_46995/m.102265 type:complete len:315 (+) Transcript_46995:107-1051(+)